MRRKHDIASGVTTLAIVLLVATPISTAAQIYAPGLFFWKDKFEQPDPRYPVVPGNLYFVMGPAQACAPPYCYPPGEYPPADQVRYYDLSILLDCYYQQCYYCLVTEVRYCANDSRFEGKAFTPETYDGYSWYQEWDTTDLDPAFSESEGGLGFLVKNADEANEFCSRDTRTAIGSPDQMHPFTHACQQQLQKQKLAVEIVRSGNSTPQTDFTMLPSLFTSTYSPYGSGAQNLFLGIRCRDPDSGAIVNNCNVALDWSAQAGSGGHVHSTSRPPGLILAYPYGVSGGSTDPGPAGSISDSTGADGVMSVQYTAPEASGDIDVTVLASALVGGTQAFSDPTPFAIHVQYPMPTPDGTNLPLQRVTGAGLMVYTASNLHDNNNGNATADTANALQELATSFSDNLFTQDIPAAEVPLIRITAISLPLGGLFDFQTEWSPPHSGHRFGNEADVGMAGFTDDQKRALARAAKDADFTTPVWAESPTNSGANHWHLRLPW